MQTVKEEVRGMLDKQRLTTFVLGGIAGALAGILLAPKSGKELRGSMAARAGEARERGRETYFEAQERMQERLAESREHQPRSKSTRSEQAAEAVSALGLEPEPVLGHEPPSEAPPPGPLPLRDVSWDVSRPESGEDPDPEEIRRKIQETRSRLRSRLGSTEPEDAPGEQDA